MITKFQLLEELGNAVRALRYTKTIENLNWVELTNNQLLDFMKDKEINYDLYLVWKLVEGIIAENQAMLAIESNICIYSHREDARLATRYCSVCHAPLCEMCGYTVRGEVYCNSCFSRKEALIS